jgi:hypothetical protein
VRSVYLIAWGITRLAFLFFWAFALPIGELNVWLKGKYLAA